MPHVELPQTQFKVVILGHTGVGKTSLVLRFTEGYYSENPRATTTGAFFLTKRVQTASGIIAKVQIWDTAGNPQFRKMAPIYWRNSAAILLCYDVSDVNSWNVALEWLKELRCDPNVVDKNIVLALVATKGDLLYETNDDLGRGHGQGHSQGQGQGQGQTLKKKRMVNMTQVEQVIQSMNHGHLYPASTTNTNGSNNNTPAATHTNNQNATGDGHILHVHISARKNENVDLLFQKVAEKVLFVRENERRVWMNHGIKYKYYSTNTISPVLVDNSGNGIGVGDGVGVGDGGTVSSEFAFLNGNNTTSTDTTAIATGTSPHHNHTSASTSTSKTNNNEYYYPIQESSNFLNSNSIPIQLSPRNHQHTKTDSNNMNHGTGTGTGTILDNNKENQYNSPTITRRGGDFSTSIMTSAASHTTATTSAATTTNASHPEESELVSHTRSRDELEKMRNVEVNTISNGLCYGCGSTNNVIDHDGVMVESSVCRIS